MEAKKEKEKGKETPKAGYVHYLNKRRRLYENEGEKKISLENEKGEKPTRS